MQETRLLADVNNAGLQMFFKEMNSASLRSHTVTLNQNNLFHRVPLTCTQSHIRNAFKFTDECRCSV